MKDLKPVWLLGLPVHPVDRQQALEAVEYFVDSGQPHLVVTADASALILARKDREFRDIFKQASLVTADGAGVVKALALRGTHLKERVCGVDMVSEIAGLAAKKGWSIFMLGAAPGVAEKASDELVRRHPGLIIAGIRDGFFEDDSEVVRQIAESRADILFVAMGMPRQEKWFWQYKDSLGVKMAMGVGGSFDVLSGQVKRAPEFFQKHGLEWLYRFASNPRKVAKVALLPVFGALVISETTRRRRLGKVIRKENNTEQK